MFESGSMVVSRFHKCVLLKDDARGQLMWAHNYKLLAFLGTSRPSNWAHVLVLVLLLICDREHLTYGKPGLPQVHL